MKGFVLLVLCFLLPLTRVWACSCSPATFQQSYDNANAVFVGKVESLVYADNQEDRFFQERRTVVIFSVSKYWKGNLPEKITLHTVEIQVSCDGFLFNPGEEYLVYAYKYQASKWLEHSGRKPTLAVKQLPKPESVLLETSLCSGTEISRHAGDSIKLLGSSKAPGIR